MKQFLFPGACLTLLALGASGVGWICLPPAQGAGDGPRAKELPRTGQFGKGLEHFDDIVPEVLHQDKLVGGALAIAKDGRLVLARGYGWANLQDKEPVRPHALFCIASVSKAITGVTIVKLIEEGKLRPDARVFDLLNVKPLPGDRVDPRLHQITVRDLLYHAGGWDAKKSGDAVHFGERVAKHMHIKPPVSQHQLIRYMMGQPLDFDPGTRSVYSNFGYVILLRHVIEHVAHQGYEEYVKQHVLRPMGITRMRLEAPHPHYAPGEVRRYGPGGHPMHPGGHQHLRGPTGSWLASAPDLARFLTAVDGSRGKGFLSEKGMQLMLAPPAPPLKVRENGSHFGPGWDVVRKTPDGYEYSKGGGEAGIRAWIEHLPGNIDWVVLYNTDQEKGAPSPLTATRKRIHQAVAQTRAWPEVDLFKE